MSESKRSTHLTRRKMSHVIDEVYTALFLAGGREVELRLRKEAEGLRLLVQGDFDPDKRPVMERMGQLLCPKVRDHALVEAYWELAGGDQYTGDSELSLVGQMLDDARVRVEEGRVEMELYLAY